MKFSPLALYLNFNRHAGTSTFILTRLQSLVNLAVIAKKDLSEIPILTNAFPLKTARKPPELESAPKMKSGQTAGSDVTKLADL